jgi:hypothetical protein
LNLLSHAESNFAEFFAMSKRSDVNIRMDELHSRAICDEIGDRLRQILPPEAGPLPPRLQYLLDRLADDELSPSIVPSLEDMGTNSLRPFLLVRPSISKTRLPLLSNL